MIDLEAPDNISIKALPVVMVEAVVGWTIQSHDWRCWIGNTL